MATQGVGVFQSHGDVVLGDVGMVEWVGIVDPKGLFQLFESKWLHSQGPHLYGDFSMTLVACFGWDVGHVMEHWPV